MDINTRFHRTPRQTFRSLALQSVRELDGKFLTHDDAALPEWGVTDRALSAGDCQVAAVGLEVLLSHCGERFTAAEALLAHALAAALRNEQFTSVVEISGILSAGNSVLGIQNHVHAA